MDQRRSVGTRYIEDKNINKNDKKINKFGLAVYPDILDAKLENLKLNVFPSSAFLSIFNNNFFFFYIKVHPRTRPGGHSR